MVVLTLLLAYLLFLPEVVLAQADPYLKERTQMVERQLKLRGIKDEKVLTAMLKVKRHLFVDEKYRDRAYGDHPLPIGEGQTISQPYVVALMTEALNLKGDEKVLEIGTGSGYQAAILAEIAKEVFTVEIRKSLYESARNRLESLGYKNVRIKNADGYFGWEEYKPFDAIIVTAAANHIPPPLLAQLKDGGRLVIPLGSTILYQNLTLVQKQGQKFKLTELCPVSFVPMVGEIKKKGN